MKKIIYVLIILLSYTAYSEEKWEIIDSINVNGINIDITLIKFVDFDSNDNMYIFASQKLIKKDAINEQWLILANEDIYPDHKYDNAFYISNASFSNGKKVIWGSSEAGLMKFSIDSGNLDIIKGQKNYGKLLGLTVDKNDNVWFASRTPYLSKWDGENFTDWDVEVKYKIIKIPFGKTNLTSLDTNVFLGGTDGLLSVSINSTPDNLIYTKYSLKDLFLKDTSLNNFGTLYKDNSDRIWASDLFGNISYFENDKWKQLILPDSLQSPDYYLNGALNKNYITNITLDSINNKLYFFWFYPYFFFTLDNAGNFSKYNFPNPDNLISIFVSNFHNNNLWLGSIYSLIKYTPPTSGVENEIAGGGLIPDIYIRNIYPNPSNYLVNAEILIFPDNVDAVHIGLYNSLGIKTMDLKNNLQLDYGTGEGTVKFDMSGLPAGAYFFCIQKGTDHIARGVFKMD